jgi:[acyl-carrier-protein] S-malonyltransferase
MNERIFLFPGQGSQAVGMGLDLFEKSEFAKKTFRRADEILGFPFSRICFSGPEEELKLTSNTQPALLTVSYILYTLWEKEPLLAAGHSLGEYSAYLCAGVFRFEDALALVHKRGRYMQEAVPVGQGAMAALIGAGIDDIRKTIEAVNSESAALPATPDRVRGVVNIANWNSAGQVVISGEKGAVEEAVRRLGGKSVFLPVSAPFHSELMLPAEEKLALDLDRVEFADPRFPVINNWQVHRVTSAAEAC